MPEMAPSRVSLYRHTVFVMREHVEDVERYTRGGYHPVDIGDTITNHQDDYTVVHKLGHSGFSTVWLVKRQRKQLASAGTTTSLIPRPEDSVTWLLGNLVAVSLLRKQTGVSRLQYLPRLGEELLRSKHQVGTPPQYVSYRVS
ncbi:hypothetical protein BT67DRAFT_435361 [Trichocladium antarcticum]|uniref:non-specific serine/threonine protein kinase n=1 Tax=Trichocladium antarcticum TaxID=1450529 RepID=A0AAN6ZCX1_9PEZI|nr:hypothetical protein BT67DRAFT_435361 [Trichocladium antarcticum]